MRRCKFLDTFHVWQHTYTSKDLPPQERKMIAFSSCSSNIWMVFTAMQYQDAIEKSAADNFKYRSWFLPFFSNPDYFFISSYFLPSKNIWHYPDSLSIIRILSWFFWLCLNKPQTAGIESLTSWLGFSGFGHYCNTSSKEMPPPMVQSPPFLFSLTTLFQGTSW